MTRKLLAVLVGVVVVAVAFWSGIIRGATHAAVDQLRGRRVLQLLGCEVGSTRLPSDPESFRLHEILGERYALRFETTGGFAPPRSVTDFVRGYNYVSCQLMRWKFGASFLEKATAEAKSDVMTSSTTLEGCMSGHGLRLRSGERVRLWASRRVPEKALDPDGPTPVVVAGEFTQVRRGKWNATHGRRLVVHSIAPSVRMRCSGSDLQPRE